MYRNVGLDLLDMSVIIPQPMFRSWPLDVPPCERGDLLTERQRVGERTYGIYRTERSV